jgi:23S rRNA (adenine2503-C2)-methyltransferase
MNSRSVYDLSLVGIYDFIQKAGEPAYRARQIWHGIYKHFWQTYEEFRILPGSLKGLLFSQYVFTSLAPVQVLESSDGETVKTLFRLEDGLLIEAVLMHYDVRHTLCISTQVGCAMGCAFCATGQMGFHRNLTSGEITEQIIYYARLLKKMGERVTNIVFMGMGEPFHNYDATITTINQLNDHEGFNLGERHFTLSTVGIVPAIKRFSDEQRQINLAISLHAANDGLRNSLLPVNKKYPIDGLLNACRYYIQKTNRRITFEYALIQDVNDSIENAHELASKLQGLLCHVNVIPLNPTRRYPGQPTQHGQADNFCQAVKQAGIPCTIRLRRGIDIRAGCGQLANLDG